MLKLALLALLITPALACPKADKPLISESLQGLGIDVGNTEFTIYEGGAYKLSMHDPKAMRSGDKTGCLTDKELADVTAAIKAAPWKTTKNAITCKAKTMRHNVYTMGAKSYDAVSCPSESMDEQTWKLFNLIDTLEQTR
ncbi:MAG: hypothetical protein QM831_36495 [Kofleriaceae bacterium]